MDIKLLWERAAGRLFGEKDGIVTKDINDLLDDGTQFLSCFQTIQTL